MMKTLRILCDPDTRLNPQDRLSIVPVYAVKGFSTAGVKELSPDSFISDPYGLFVNRLFHEEELSLLKQFLKSPLVLQAETISFADPAVLSFADRSLRERLIYRPETLMTNAADARFWLSAGIHAVSISPVLTEEETLDLIRNVHPSEVMIHGHLLLSVSARRLISAWLEKYGMDTDIASSRNLFIEEVSRSEKLPIMEAPYGTMIYSDTCMCCFERISEFADNGAENFFMNGAFLSPQDINEAASIYAGLLSGSDVANLAEAYRKKRPYCSEGFYDRSTIL